MSFRLPDGVWPTMITPFREDGTLDLEAIKPLVDWYLSGGVAGLFAVCQSSEMFFLQPWEREALAREVVKAVAGRCPIIASGHVADDPEQQREEILAMADTGVDAVVLVSNRMATGDEPESAWRNRTEQLLSKVPADIPLGMYECPYPYRRLISLDSLRWMAETGRFYFLKDTSCLLDILQSRASALAGTPLALYNANSATLLESLRWGYAGFSGVMANFHPELYVRLQREYASDSPAVRRLQDFLGFASIAECQYYPVNAKYHLRLCGVPIGMTSRAKDASIFDESLQIPIRQMKAMAEEARHP